MIFYLKNYDKLVDGNSYINHGVEIQGGHRSDPIENCIDFVFKNRKLVLCDCGNFFLGMFQKVGNDYIEKSTREWEFLPFEYRLIDNITNEKYYYLVNLKEWSGKLVVSEKLMMKLKRPYSITSTQEYWMIVVVDEEILFNYGYEGFGSITNGGDSILTPKLLNKLHKLLDENNLPHESIVYVDSNVRLNEIELDTKVDFWGYEYY